MHSSRPIAVLTLAAALSCLAAPTIPAEGYESPPDVKASDVLPAEKLTGPHHRVADTVTSDGVALLFTIESDFGEFVAPSRDLALLRIDEVAAIAALKEMGSSEMFAKALAASVEKKAETVANVVKDPKGAAQGAGKGLKRLWGKAKKGAGDVAEKAQEDDDGEKQGEKPSAGDVSNEVLGVNKAKRQLAKAVSADPYTSNVPLQAELDRLARAMVAGGITGGLGTRIPGIDAMASVGDLAWNVPPEDLKARNQKTLAAMGCDEKCQNPLLRNEAYTPSKQTALVVGLEALDGLKDRAAIVQVASGAENEAEAVFYRSSLALLAAAKKDGRALAEAQPFGRAPAALTSDGTLVVAAAADLLVWTEDLAEAADRPAEGAGKRELWLTGKLTDRTRSELQSRGWTVREEVAAR